MFSTQENTIPHAPARFPISERGGDVHSRTKTKVRKSCNPYKRTEDKTNARDDGFKLQASRKMMIQI
jgi:hypothetical protein